MGNYPLQDVCLAVICGTPVIATICTGLRILARRTIGVKLRADDWLIIAATVLSLALIGPSYEFVKLWHIGIHIWDVSQKDMEPPFDRNYRVQLSFNLINYLILPLVKASLIMLLLRVGAIIDRVRYALYALLTIVIAAAVIPWFIMLFMCPPRTGNTWAATTFGGARCVNRVRIGKLQIFVTSFSLLTDLLVLPIPFIISQKLVSLSLRSRLVIGAIFASTLAVTAISAAKIYLTYLDRLYVVAEPDWTYPIDYCINHIENNVAILVACLPTYRGLFTQWRDKPTIATADIRCTYPTYGLPSRPGDVVLSNVKADGVYPSRNGSDVGMATIVTNLVPRDRKPGSIDLESGGGSAHSRDYVNDSMSDLVGKP
ncbi:hypothetical protein V496_03185 [Pseudogymnoascus sp. VKM F-4515 (FW-2607)]|nr:hypothetical protein V496_03185 [Pseudogymnoascus sp. VKM F-4515 (FW-2607)]KFY98641.1 hypothetical protein V498_01349 [Pseudogymnoascus sp. VKM F-4517 (FW-2822)]